MAVDPRQVLAAFLTISMFAMLRNMIKKDPFNNAEDFVNIVIERRGGGLAVMNAFELISTSQGLNLGNVFENQMGTVKWETRFASRLPEDEILSKIEQAARLLEFNVEKQNYKICFPHS